MQGIVSSVDQYLDENLLAASRGKLFRFDPDTRRRVSLPRRTKDTECAVVFVKNGSDNRSLRKSSDPPESLRGCRLARHEDNRDKPENAA